MPGDFGWGHPVNFLLESAGRENQRAALGKTVLFGWDLGYHELATEDFYYFSIKTIVINSIPSS